MLRIRLLYDFHLFFELGRLVLSQIFSFLELFRNLLNSMFFKVDREDLVSAQYLHILHGKNVIFYLHMGISELFRLGHDFTLLSIIYAGETVAKKPVEAVNLFILKRRSG